MLVLYSCLKLGKLGNACNVQFLKAGKAGKARNGKPRMVGKVGNFMLCVVFKS